MGEGQPGTLGRGEGPHCTSGPHLGLFKGKGLGRADGEGLTAEAGLYRWTDGRGVGLREAHGGSWRHRWMPAGKTAPHPEPRLLGSAHRPVRRAPLAVVKAATGPGGAHTVYVLTDL